MTWLRRRWWLAFVALALAAGAVLAVVSLRGRGPRRDFLSLGGPVTALAYAPDGRSLAAATWGSGEIGLFDAATAAPLQTLPARANVHALAFSPDGRFLAVADDATPLSAFELPAGTPVELPAVGPGPATSLAFAPDTRELAVGFGDGTVALLSLEERVIRRRLRGHGLVLSVARGPGGALAVGDDAGNIALYQGDVLRTRIVARLGGVQALAFAPLRPWLAAAGDGPLVRLFAADDGRELFTLGGHDERIPALAFSPDGGTLATASGDGTVRLWDPATGQSTHRLEARGTSLQSLSYAPSGLALTAGDADGRVLLWKLSPRRAP